MLMNSLWNKIAKNPDPFEAGLAVGLLALFPIIPAGMAAIDATMLTAKGIGKGVAGIGHGFAAMGRHVAVDSHERARREHERKEWRVRRHRKSATRR